jgi:hypothetical protein
MNHQHASRQTTLCRNSHLNCLTFFTMGTQREATASRYVPSPCLGRSVDLLSMVCPSKPKPADRFAASWLRPSGHCLTQKHARANQPCFVETDCLGQKEHLCPTVFWALAQKDHGYCHPASSHGYNVHSMTRLHPFFTHVTHKPHMFMTRLPLFSFLHTTILLSSSISHAGTGNPLVSEAALKSGR